MAGRWRGLGVEYRRARAAVASAVAVYSLLSVVFPLKSQTSRVGLLVGLVVPAALMSLVTPYVVRRQQRQGALDVLTRRASTALMSDARRELQAAVRRNLAPWWWGDPAVREPHGADELLADLLFLEDFVAFWVTSEGLDPTTMKFFQREAPFTPADLGAPAGLDDDDPRTKAALVRVEGMIADVRPRLECRAIKHSLVQWVERHGVQPSDQVSTFGVQGWLPWPSLTVVHAVLETADRFVVFSLRGGEGAYFPLTWSVSFEEQVELGYPAPDVTVFDTFERGFRDEFGNEPEVAPSPAEVRCLAIGRERVVAGKRVVRNAGLLLTARLPCSVDELWSLLRQRESALDRREHIYWMACRFRSARDVAVCIETFGGGGDERVGPRNLTSDPRLAVEVSTWDGASEPFGGRAFGWHPTSRPRLALWAAHARAAGRLPA